MDGLTETEATETRRKAAVMYTLHALFLAGFTILNTAILIFAEKNDLIGFPMTVDRARYMFQVRLVHFLLTAATTAAVVSYTANSTRRKLQKKSLLRSIAFFAVMLVILTLPVSDYFMNEYANSIYFWILNLCSLALLGVLSGKYALKYLG